MDYNFRLKNESNRRISPKQPVLWLFILLTIPVDLLSQSIQLPLPELITARQGLPQAFVPAIVQDRQGFIWMATRDGLCRYDGYEFKVFQPAANGKPALSSSGLSTLAEAPDGGLWITTDQRDLDYVDPISEQFLNVSHRPYYRRAVGHDTLEGIYPDHRHRIWLILRQQGLICFDLRTQRYRRFKHQPADLRSLGSNQVNAVIDDAQNVIWIATADGLDQFDEQTGEFHHFRHQPRQAASIPENTIHHLYRRHNGELWLQSHNYLTRWNPQTNRAQSFSVVTKYDTQPCHITSDSQGNDYILGSDQLFIYSDAGGLHPLTTHGEARLYISLFVDQSDVLWVGTDLAGVYKFNLRAAAFTNRSYHGSFQNDLLTDYLNVPVVALPRWPVGTSPYNFRYAIDRNNRFWFSVGGTPIYRLDKPHAKPVAVSFPKDLRDSKFERPTLMASDPDGRIWVVHPNWTGYFDQSVNRWIPFSHPLLPVIQSPMLQVVIDRRALWIATSAQGLYRVDRQTGSIRHFEHQSRNPTSLSSNNLYWLSADPLNANQLWIGTFGSGLCRFDKRNGHCQRITTQQGLPNNVIYAAIPDQQGFVWVATNQGLGQLNRRTGQVRTYTQEDGLNADEFNRFHALSLPDGRIVLGGVHGITGFDPTHIGTDTFQPKVQLVEFLVNNRPLLAQSVNIDQPVSQLASLSLPYNQNFLTVRFAAMQYKRLGRTQYRYQLVGLDNAWVVTNRPEAIYTALQPGEYQLRIQAANTAGQWSNHVRQLTLSITPPWWASSWAYGSYVLLLGLLVYGICRTWLNRQRLRQVVQLRQQEAEQLRILDETKSRFFANITHELRTPLTLILGPTEQLKSVIENPAWRYWLATIDRNAQLLLNLINQLLDISRLEAGVVKVEKQRGDVSAFVSQLVESIRPEAEAKGLKLTFIDQLCGETYWFDAEKLERIGLNLLSNALKFTRQGGIRVTLQPGVRLLVQDTGSGIATEELGKIFDRFYRGKQHDTVIPGSGIGLALVKELVDLQGGTVTVTSQQDKTAETALKSHIKAAGWSGGTCVTVVLPYQRAVALPSLPTSASDIDEVTIPTEQEEAKSGESPLVLIVEDNADLSHFIAQSLPLHYRIQRASDGVDGLAEAVAHGPDLIISDVIMPRMDGYTLCQTLKKDPRTSHIPVILLTAKVTHQDRITGLLGGADEYLTKPFRVEELQLRVRNLLDRQHRQRAWVRATLSDPGWPISPEPIRPETLITDSIISTAPVITDPFMVKLETLIEQHANDTQFGVEEMALLAGMSRVHLYRKVKALTGLTVSELLRNYRLKEATRLLRAGHSVTETCYRVGFESPAYFGKCFRELYGLTPSDFSVRGIDGQKRSKE